jgi:hypothetical protein
MMQTVNGIEMREQLINNTRKKRQWGNRQALVRQQTYQSFPGRLMGVSPLRRESAGQVTLLSLFHQQVLAS